MHPSGQEDLYKYIHGVLKKKKCFPYQINGIEDHLHIFTHIHPAVNLSNLVKDIKLSTHSFIKEKGIFPNFKAWQIGYSAFTYNHRQKNTLINYVKNQKQHHNVNEDYDIEIRRLYNENGVEIDEKYIFE